MLSALTSAAMTSFADGLADIEDMVDVDVLLVSVVDVDAAALSEARSRPSAGLLPNAARSASMSVLVLRQRARSAPWGSLPLARSSTFTNCTSDGVDRRQRFDLVGVGRAGVDGRDERAEARLHCDFALGLGLLRRRILGGEMDGVTIAAMAAVATAARRVRVCIGDSFNFLSDARQRSPDAAR